MEGLRFGGGGQGQKSLRVWIVFLVMLPPAFLGAAYFLFVEYLLQDQTPLDPALHLTLRLGGLGLVLLSLVLAAAFGYLMLERVTRPIRLLLRLAEAGNLASNRSLFEQERGPEIYALYRLVSSLVTQNKSGARALEELERLRTALATMREEVSRRGQHGIPPAVTLSLEAPVGEIGASLQSKRVQLLTFFEEIRARLTTLREEVAGVERDFGGRTNHRGAENGGAEVGQPVEDSAVFLARAAEAAETERRHVAEIRASVERVRRLGGVLTLEAARLGGPEERVQQLQRRFDAGLGELEQALEGLERLAAARGNGDIKAALVEHERQEAIRRETALHWHHLHEGLGTLERLLGEVEER